MVFEAICQKLEFFDDVTSKNIYYIDYKDILPKVNISKASVYKIINKTYFIIIFRHKQKMKIY